MDKLEVIDSLEADAVSDLGVVFGTACCCCCCCSNSGNIKIALE